MLTPFVEQLARQQGRAQQGVDFPRQVETRTVAGLDVYRHDRQGGFADKTYDGIPPRLVPQPAETLLPGGDLPGRENHQHAARPEVGPPAGSL